MTRKQRKILIAWTIVAVGILLFPHYSYKIQSSEFDQGWGFLLTGPFDSHDREAKSATVDLGLLIIMEFLGAGICGVAFWLIKDKEQSRIAQETRQDQVA